ncbi:hypothetical protein ACIRBX_11520 [Kitasatospora sp. NPDC096147]|uniref:hypothetical protein n=1 Tax=Kitasatospora sp. NPDC096147 TaxID=3364093 RepID=UPI0038191701
MTGHQEPPRQAVPGTPADAAPTDTPPHRAPTDAPPADAPPTDAPPTDEPPAGPPRETEPTDPGAAPDADSAADSTHRLPTVWTGITGLLAALTTLGHLLAVTLTPWQPSPRPLPIALLAAAALTTAAWITASWFAPPVPHTALPSPPSWLRAVRHGLTAGLAIGALSSLFAPLDQAAGRVWLAVALTLATATAVGSRIRQHRIRTGPVNRELRLLAPAYLGAWPAAWSAYHLLRPGSAPLSVGTRLGQLVYLPWAAALVAMVVALLITAVVGAVRRIRDN